MKRLNQIRQNFSLCVFASLFLMSSQAFAEITLPTAVEFEKAISFQKPDGEPVQLKAGIYEVALGGENELKFDPVGTGGSEITVQALPANHDETFEEAKALLTPAPDNNPDKQHVILWMPEGVALEAIGSYSGLFSRSTLTWGTTEEGKDTGEQEPLTINLDKALYFKTAGGDPKILKPGDYEVGLADDGMVLTPVDGKPEEAITVEPESLGTSAAVILPELDGNSNLELLVLATVGGQSLIAIGSEDGTFPRGLWGKIKGAAKKGARAAYKKAKKGARAAYGKAKKHGRKYAGKAINAAKKHGKKYAAKLGKGALKYGYGALKKICGKGKQAACLKYGAAAAAAVS